MEITKWMIPELVSTVYADVKILKAWAFDSDPPAEASKGVLLHMAAIRTISALGMILAALWVFSELSAIITYPIRLALNLLIPTIMAIVLRDIFVMCQNISAKESLVDAESGLWGVLTAIAESSPDEAIEITKDTMLQSAWLWLHTKKTVFLKA